MSVKWIDVKTTDGKTTLRVALIDFDAKLAAEWLEAKNKRNRPLGRGDVRKYMLAMLGGEWELNAEPIILDDKDRLVNGQHRLQAIVDASKEDANIAVTMLVVAGVKSKAFDTMDQGRARSLADVLAVNNEENARVMAGALRLLWQRLDSKKVSGSGQLRAGVAVDLLKKHPGLHESVALFVGDDDGKQGLEAQTKESEDCETPLSKVVGSLSHAATLHYLFSQSGVEDAAAKATEFFRGLAFGVEDDGETALPNDEPRKRARLVLVKSATSENRLTRDGRIAVLIKAWQAFIDGEKLSRINVAKGEFPRIGGLDCEPEEKPEAEEEAQEGSEEVAETEEKTTTAKKSKPKTKAKAKV